MDDGEGSGIKLVTEIGPYHEPPCSEDGYLRDGHLVWQFRNVLKYIGLDKSFLPSSGLLPEFLVVSEIEVGTGRYRLHPSMCAILTKALRSVCRVNSTLEMPIRRCMFQRRQTRIALVDALRDASLDILKVLHIQLPDERL